MPTLARLSFWIPEDRDAEFAETFEKKALPLLQEHGLTQPSPDERPSVTGVFRRLFEVETPAQVLPVERTLGQDPDWQGLMQMLGSAFSAETGTPLSYHFGLYATPAGPGQTMASGPGFRNGVWHHFSVRDGLPSALVSALLQDRDGFLWVATSEGVCRYDGAEWVTFTTADGLVHNSVRCMARDRQGHLWFGTGDWIDGHGWGVSRYDGRQFTTFTRADGLAGHWIGSIVEDRDGWLWFGTENGVSRYDGQRFTTFTTEQGLVHNFVWPILSDRAGQLWFGTQGGGVSRYDGQTFTSFTATEGLGGSWVETLLEDRDGQLWFGMEEGLSRYDGQAFTTFTTEQGLAEPWVAALAQDGEGSLWVATYPQGLSRYDGQAFTGYTTADGLPSNLVVALLADREGPLWVGTHGGGVSRYDGHTIRVFTTQDGLADNGLYTLLEDCRGHLWVGTFKGVSRYDGKQFTSYPIGESPAHRAAMALLEDQAGRLWVGDHGGDVKRLEGETFVPVLTGQGQRGHTSRCLVEDGEGVLWCATGGEGVLRYDGEQAITLTQEDGLVDPDVRCLARDRQGHLWFATGRGGVSRYDGQQFVTVTTGDGLGHHSARCLLEDRQGHLWFATTGGGVSRYDGQQFTRFTTTDGLACNSVLSLLEDQRGHLWLGTQGGGVSRYDGQVFQTLSQEDGLPSDVVVGLLEDRHGAIWLATEGGLTRYLPNQRRPTVRLREVLADETYGPVAELTLPVSQAWVRFTFQGSSFTTRPEGLVYVYCLEGHDPSWQVTRQRQVTYAGLEQGAYTFWVKAVDRDLNYSEPISVAVQVTPDPRLEGWQAALKQSSGSGEFVGQSAALQQVLVQLGQAAQAEVTVLILGETGTGKGLAARTVHEQSPRKDGPFLQINCGAIAEGLVESELFGHEKGAFTGAHARQLGKVELAAGGTLFLDEIGDLSLDLQVKLLRLLEERTFERVGGAETLTAEVRVIAATNRDLEQMVQAGTFRADLFYRLHGFPVRLPPLRERREDIPALVDHFLSLMATHLDKEVNGVTSEALALLKGFAWPGNVRELKNGVERAVIVCAGKQIQAADLMLGREKPEEEAGERVTLVEHERQYIHQVLTETGWVIKGPDGAAAVLGLHPATLQSRLKKLGLERPRG